MERGITASEWAQKQVAVVRDDPVGRVSLVERSYHGPFGKAPRHLPYRRAAMSFMRWQLRRGVLEPAHSDRPGSPWWREVNERLLLDGCEAIALSGDLPGPASSTTVGVAAPPLSERRAGSSPVLFRRWSTSISRATEIETSAG